MSDRATHDAPYWCEENAWHLCVDPRIGANAHVVIISNPTRTVALLHQRATPGVPVIWDYHVIVVAHDRIGAAQVWDLDSTLGFPLPLAAYASQTFPSGVAKRLAPRFAPRFRIIAVADYRARFGSDRRHMRDGRGGWQQPPPPWPQIGSEHALDAILDFDDRDFGPWLELDSWLRRQSSAVP